HNTVVAMVAAMREVAMSAEASSEALGLVVITAATSAAATIPTLATALASTATPTTITAPTTTITPRTTTAQTRTPGRALRMTRATPDRALPATPLPLSPAIAIRTT